ncbi:MAG: extracellular solute-binding protein [Oscillospiraceae bacterium]|nr:extracellular solute-binding protein [Oscillospiraceae bacterium]
MKSNRNLRKPLLALGLCAAIISGFFVACRHEPNEPNEPPPAQDTGIVLNIFQPHAAHATMWDALAVEYRNATGVTLNVHRPAAGTVALEELRDALEREENKPALFFFHNPREYHAWHEHAHNLSETTAYGHLIDRNLALRVLVEDDENSHHNVVAIPLGVEAFGIIYNESIMTAYFALDDRSTEFNSVADITTHAELEALVRDMHAHREALDIDAVFAAPALREGESHMWGTRLMAIPHGQEINSRNMDVTGEHIDELHLRYHEGLRDFYRLHHEHMTEHEGLEGRSYADAAAEFGTGRVAMIMGGSGFVGYLSGVANQTVNANEVAFMPAFMRMESASRQGLAFETVKFAAINGRADQEHIDAAEQFLTWLVTHERGMDFLTNRLGVIAPFDTVVSSVQMQNPLMADAVHWLQNEQVNNTVTWSMLAPGDEFRDQVVGEGLRYHIRGEHSWSEFMEDIREGWARHRARMEY